MKRIFVLVLVLGVVAGCSNRLEREETNDIQSSQGSEKKEQEVQEFSTDKSEQTNEFPYEVNLSELVVAEDHGGAHPTVTNPPIFINSGVNNPSQFMIGDGTPYTNGRSIYVFPSMYDPDDHSNDIKIASYPIDVSTIPTKEIEVFYGKGVGKRTVKVNTQLVLDFNESTSYGNEGGQYDNLNGSIFYLFYNSQGSVSLATTNFSGNVDVEDSNVMMEYILDE